MNRFCPTPSLPLFCAHACVIEPHPIEKVAVAIRTSGPRCRGDCVDDGGKIVLALLESLRTISLSNDGAGVYLVWGDPLRRTHTMNPSTRPGFEECIQVESD